MEPITFTATLANTLSAIRLHGQDSSSRLDLEIPASEVAQVAKLLLYQGQAFKVTIEEYGGEQG